MDKALKVRKLASASVRRQRSEEREQQRQQLYQEREDRKRKMMRMSEIYSTDGSDSSRPNSPENDSSADTPSEYSLKTPENSFSPDVEIKDQSAEIPTPTHTQKEDDTNIIAKPTILERRLSKLDSPKQIMFTSSLNRPCDFRYDRFSTIIDPVDLSLSFSLKEIEVEEEETSSLSSTDEKDEKDEKNEITPVKVDVEKDETKDEEDDDDDSEDEDDDEEEDYSPIELATPVAIRMPVSRPAVVSVVATTSPGPQPGPHKFLVTNINTIMINPPKKPTPKPFIVETNPTPTPDADSVKDYGFPIVETKSIEAATPPPSGIKDIEPSSTKSLPTTAAVNVDNNLKKKSSMPMLTKFTHARMHSIKNFMKPQSISGPPPAVPIIPSTHQPRPSESLTNILLSVSTHRSKPSVIDKSLPASPRHPPSPRRSLTEPNFPKVTYHEQRPQTARNPSQNTITTLSGVSHSNVTALPPPLPKAASPKQAPPSIAEEPELPPLNRKKSFPNFRRRSGSLGQALKFGSSGKSKPSTPDEPLPPLPLMRTPTQESNKSMNFPPPPVRTPKPSRKSGMMYSPFPPPSQKGEPVGLGLRM